MKTLWSITTLILIFVVTARAEKQDVTFRAADGFTLKGTFYSAEKPGPGVLLLHPCDGNRHIYDHLATMLNTAGYNVLTFDFRGFGGSQAGEYTDSRNQWKENPAGLLFPNRTGRPRKRANVVRFGLKPVLQKLGLPTKGVGLHAFRHGLGTALSNSRVSPKTVQQILRHTDIKTTFRYYVHSDTDAQREALASVAIGTNVPIGTTAGT